MSRENIESFKRALEAYNRRDVEALLQELAPEVEWHPVLEGLLGGEATVYRGHEGVRELLRITDETLGEIFVEFSEIQDLWRSDRCHGPSPHAWKGKRGRDRVAGGLRGQAQGWQDVSDSDLSRS